MRSKLLAAVGGSFGAMWQAVQNAVQDHDWFVKVVFGAIIGTIVSIAVNEIYKLIKSSIREYFQRKNKRG